MRRIALFGGTFNPVHNEHIKMVKTAIKELRLDKIFVIPTNLPPHKKTTLISGEHRLKMLSLCFASEKKVEISDFEIKNGGTSYSYLTAEHFRRLFPDDDIFFLVGGDMLKDFKTWKFPQRILSACKLAVFERDDFYCSLDEEREYFKKFFNQDFINLKYKGENLSSTRVRIYSSLGLNLYGLTDEKVAKYIFDNNLYAGDKAFEFIKKTLPERRLIHTAEVAVTALKKVKELNLDKDKVLTACILHDCAKYIDYRTVEGFKLPDGVPAPVIHSFLGAFIAEKYLGVVDEEIIDAIRYHTSGKPNMSVLGKLIFVADMIEKGRSYEGVDYLRDMYEKDFNLCFKECLKEETVHLINRKQNIYSETLSAYEYYINQNNV